MYYNWIHTGDESNREKTKEYCMYTYDKFSSKVTVFWAYKIVHSSTDS